MKRNRVTKISRTAQAMEMLAKGYPRRVIEIECGASNKEISKIASEMIEAGIEIARNQKSAKRNRKSLIATKMDMRITLAILSIYLRINESYSHDPIPSIKIDLCEKTLALVQASGITYISRNGPIEVKYGDVYYIAKLYQAREIGITTCPICKEKRLVVFESGRKSECFCSYQ